MLYSTQQLVMTVLTVVLVMGSAIVHEVAHGAAALALGDPTAKEAGRLTLDPRAHLDGFGSVVLPLVMALIGGPVFAFAKPVPYNPRRLRHPRSGELLVALAGPAANLAQAFVGAALVHLAMEAMLGGVLPVSAGYWVLEVLTTYVWVNLVLCFFNLIPLPPLDGGKVILFLLTGDARRAYYRLEAYAMPILIVLLYVLPGLLHVDPLGAYLNATAGGLYDLMWAAM